MLAKGNGHGASRQTIVKYVEGRKEKGTKVVTSQMVKSAIMRALNSGLLVHSSGVGLNGSFIIPEKSVNRLTGTCLDKQKPIITKEAKLRCISSLAGEIQCGPDHSDVTDSTVKTVTTKRRRNSKILVPFADSKSLHQYQLETESRQTDSSGLKAILKTPSQRKFAAKRKQKRAGRKVKFCSPPSVFLISPCIKRRSKRKK